MKEGGEGSTQQALAALSRYLSNTFSSTDWFMFLTEEEERVDGVHAAACPIAQIDNWGLPLSSFIPLYLYHPQHASPTHAFGLANDI